MTTKKPDSAFELQLSARRVLKEQRSERRATARKIEHEPVRRPPSKPVHWHMNQRGTEA